MIALDARAVAHALGGSVMSRNSVAAPGPGHSRADRSLSIKLAPGAPDGFVVYSHAGDDPIHCRDYVRERLGLPSWRPCRPNEKRSPAPAPIAAPARDEGKSENRAIALWIWQESQNPRGTIAEAYLKSRALQLTDDIAGDVVRFHPRVWHKTSQMPLAAMVALFRDIRSSEPKAIHRTYLRADGTKIERKMLGAAGGCAIKIDPDAMVTTGLTIGEGLETCLAARMGGFRPAWALGSAGAIGSFPVLSGIEGLTLLGETDKTGANERAVRECAGRWMTAGAEVRVVKPKRGGDLNDVLREVAA
ncbi:MAG TPA: toprim domain-containing protein [Pseudolabrys sp.]|uniref:DUF7146 domain-containing protein n=1 Tax=Pseudolabrys sp. TaxID=1960880 RepID=UPI002DDCD5AF|nr:toprim domain-containing protein [Pseudolabrys sp.]HEV2627245.1 toprim domain-containing protein [Pseudolabrys sp.]